MPDLISSIHGNLGLNGLDTYVPTLADSANIRDALELFYYGTLTDGSSNTFSIYNHLNTFNTHTSASANVHGLTGGAGVVGTTSTQTLTNKTLTSPTINAATLSGTIAGNFTTSGTITNSGTISGGTVNATTYQQSGVAGFLIPTGVIVPYSASVAPTGWLICNGQTLNASITPSYLPLWNVIGTTYGGSGSASFYVPNLQGRTIIGYGTGTGNGASGTTGSAPSGTGLTSRPIGSWTGAETHTLQQTEMPAHYHTFSWQETSGGTGDLNPSDSGYGGQGQPQYAIDTSGSPTGTYNVITNNAGGNGAHNNMQPALTLNYIIKV